MLSIVLNNTLWVKFTVKFSLLDRFSDSFLPYKALYVQMMDLYLIFQSCRLIPLAFVAIVLENELQYHGLAACINSANDACISCENFVKFGQVTPELTGHL